MSSHTLNPVMPVLVRPDGSVQVGWDPRRAMLVAVSYTHLTLPATPYV